MAFGPGRTLPVGHRYQERLKEIEKQIDNIIQMTEGEEIRIYPIRIADIEKYKDGLIPLYLQAGWRRVEWVTKSLDGWHLLLSNVKGRQDA